MIYRINKIVDQLDLNLEDADTRLRLLISFEVLKRLGKFKVDDKIRELEEGQALPGMQKD